MKNKLKEFAEELNISFGYVPDGIWMGREIIDKINNLYEKYSNHSPQTKCPYTGKEGYVEEEDCHCFCCGIHDGIPNINNPTKGNKEESK